MIGGPKHLYNLFSLFPVDSYVVLTSADAIDPRSAATGFWLAGKYLYYDRDGDVEVPRNWKPGDPAGEIPIHHRVVSWIRRIPRVGKALLDGLYLLVHVPRVVRTADTVIRKEGITGLLGISDEGLAMLGTYLVHKISGLPYSLYFFDLYLGNDLSFFARGIARILEPRLIRNARLVIVTNEAAGEYLRRKYGSSFRLEILHNSAFPEDFEGLRKTAAEDLPLRILFAGNIYWPQEAAVLNMIAAMDLLQDIPVEFVLYCPNPPESIRTAVAGRPNVRLTSAPQSEMPRVQCEADLLFLPLAWGTEAPDIIATASPGKFTDYLASGRPMLVHAPDDSYVSRYAKMHDLGIVVDRDDVHALEGAVRTFFRGPERGDHYVENALQIFKENHDARKNSGRLWALLTESSAR